MAFHPQTNEDGKTFRGLTTGSTAFVKGSAVKYTSGYLTAAAAGDASVDYISLETKTSTATDGTDSLLVMRVDPSMTIQANTSITPVQATHVGNRYDLATGVATIDLAATTDKIFIIDRIVNATDKIVEGRFMQAIA